MEIDLFGRDKARPLKEMHRISRYLLLSFTLYIRFLYILMSFWPDCETILPPALSQGRRCLAVLESRSDCPVIHHVTLTPGAQ